MMRSAEAMLGRRYSIAASSPWATAARAGSSQLPRWLAKISAGLPSSRSCANNSWVRGRNFDAAVLGARRIVLPDVIEMGELGADAAEIVPDAGENGRRSPRRFLRKGGGQIGAADPLLAQHRSDQAGDAAEQVGGLDRIEITRGAQQSDRQCADRGFASGLVASRMRALVRGRRRASEVHDDLAEHLPAFHALERGGDILDRHFGIDHRDACRRPSCRGSRQCCAGSRRTNRRCGTAAGTVASD